MMIAAKFYVLCLFLFLGIFQLSSAQWSNNRRTLRVVSPSQLRALVSSGRRIILRLNPQQITAPRNDGNRQVVVFNGGVMRSFSMKQGQTILIPNSLIVHQAVTVPAPTVIHTIKRITQPIPKEIYPYSVVDEDSIPDAPDAPDAPDTPASGSKSTALSDTSDQESDSEEAKITTEKPEEATNVTNVTDGNKTANTTTAPVSSNAQKVISSKLVKGVNKNVSSKLAVTEKSKSQSAATKELKKHTAQDKIVSKISVPSIETDLVSTSIVHSAKSSNVKETVDIGTSLISKMASVSGSNVLGSQQKIIVSDSIDKSETKSTPLRDALRSVGSLSTADTGVHVNPGDSIILKDVAPSTHLIAHSQEAPVMQSNTRDIASPKIVVGDTTQQLSGVIVEPLVSAGFKKDEGTKVVFTDVQTNVGEQIQVQTQDASKNLVLLSDKNVHPDKYTANKASHTVDVVMEVVDQKKPLTNMIKSGSRSVIKTPKPRVNSLSASNAKIVSNALNKVRGHMRQEPRKIPQFSRNSFVGSRRRSRVHTSSQRRSRIAFVRYWRNILRVLSNFTGQRSSDIQLVRAKAKDGRDIIVAMRRPKPRPRARKIVPVYIY